ncbi:MAG: nucleotidyltransferase family protein [Pseudomonadota bacterium]
MAAMPDPMHGDHFDALLREVRGYAAGRPPDAEMDDARVLGMAAEAIHHKLLPLVASRYRLHPGLSRPLRSHLGDLHRAAAHRLAVYVREALWVQRLLAAGGVGVLFRKGAVLPAMLYATEADRYCADVDLYCAPAQARQAFDALRGAGCRTGEQDAERRFRPHTRAEEVFTTLYPDHLPRLVLPLEDEPAEPSVAFDVSLDLGWSMAPLSGRRAGMLVHEIAAGVTTGNGLRTSGSPAFHFLDVALHMFRDAYFQKTIGERKDVHLSKFLDLELLWRCMGAGERARLDALAREAGARGVLAWVAHHGDAVFGCGMAAALGLAEPEPGWPAPDTWQAADGSVRAWRGSMVQRLRAKSGAVPYIELKENAYASH